MTRFSVVFPCVFSLFFLGFFTGCGVASKAIGASEIANGMMLSGSVHGGQQPISGASVTLMVPGTSTYGAAATVLASTTTNSTGGFTLPSYTCPANSGLVYLLASGGNSGAGVNSAIVEAAVLGPCNLLTPSTFINVSEVTTIAAAYALAPFASVSASGTGIGAPASNLQGLSNAFGAAKNLVNLQTGNARGTAEISGLVLPQLEMNTLANILASCVNQAATTTLPCTTLFSAVAPANPAIDTFQAALDIALNPGANVTALYGLAAASAPFQPTLTTAPSDFALGIQYTGGSIAGSYGTQGIAIDSLGNAWVATGNVINSLGSTHDLVEITPSGVYQSGATGYGASSLTSPEGIAIDANNNVYVTDPYPSTIVKFASNGSLTSTFSPRSAASPFGIAIDTDGTFWVANVTNTVSHITTSGVDATNSPYAVSASGGPIALNATGNWTAGYGNGSTGYISRYIDAQPAFDSSISVTGHAVGVALDSSGFAWYSANATGSGTIGRLNTHGVSNLTPVALASGLEPGELLIDGLNHVWVSAFNQTAQSTPGVLLEYSSTGALLSSANGYSANGILPPLPGSPEGLAVDGSGNLWLTGEFVDNSGTVQANAVVTELIGIAAPVVTPVAVAASGGTLGMRP